MSNAGPICATSLEPQFRYPSYVCQAYANRARSADGHSLTFANEGCDGGYVATCADTREPTTPTTWIDDVARGADEARFGGNLH